MAEDYWSKINLKSINAYHPRAVKIAPLGHSSKTDNDTIITNKITKNSAFFIVKDFYKNTK